MPKYFDEIDVNELFKHGATSFRLDPATANLISKKLDNAEWVMPDLPEDVIVPEFAAERPLARFSAEDQRQISTALDEVFADEALFRPFQRYGTLVTNSVSAFNGSIDTDWHHDGLAGNRGHAGEFFLLCYIGRNGRTDWREEWGGAFEYGERTLGNNWVHNITAPDHVRRILPHHRTCVLGWNLNPLLVHRSAPLLAKVDRHVVVAAVRHVGTTF
jgi:hypothetical protein